MCLPLFCIFLYLIEVIQASPTPNTTNTTTTNNSFKAPSFTTRTLWTIISSSVLTLFACIYSAIHPNIPSPKNSSWYHILWRQLGIMIMALIAPELIVTWAMRQLFSAHQVTRQFKESGLSSASLSCLLQACRRLFGVSFVLSWGGLQGGFSQSNPSPTRKASQICAHPNVDSYASLDFTWTRTHSFFVLMGGFMLYVNEEPYRTLQPKHILKLIHDKCIKVPTLTANQIHDKSKGNAISKGLVVLQVAWFVMQLITRAIYHLETTQLEVGTLAFAVLNFLTYAVWWDKPLDVRCPHPVYWKSTESRPEDHINDRDEFAQLRYLPRVFSPIIELIGWADIPTSRKLQVPTFDGSIELNVSDKTILQQAALIMAIIFGGIHCMAWFFAFPTYEEQVLWRISAVVTTCTPCLCLSAYLNSEIIDLVRRLPDSERHIIWGVYLMTCYALVTLYITARVVLLVLMFTTLRNLPPDAYKVVSWTSLVPHL
ncbi:hypothetical protein C8R48DRAFT_620845 [Suillus tomentosus]|nr:hypothetical protein C8R48DRAFT_620845 [Suillus tomentosus]